MFLPPLPYLHYALLKNNNKYGIIWTPDSMTDDLHQDGVDVLTIRSLIKISVSALVKFFYVLLVIFFL